MECFDCGGICVIGCCVNNCDLFVWLCKGGLYYLVDDLYSKVFKC